MMFKPSLSAIVIAAVAGAAFVASAPIPSTSELSSTVGYLPELSSRGPLIYGREVDRREGSPEQVYQDAVCALPEHKNDPDCHKASSSAKSPEQVYQDGVCALPEHKDDPDCHKPASRREESPEQVYQDAVCALPEHRNDPDCQNPQRRRGPSGSASNRSYKPRAQLQKRYGNAHATYYLQKGVAGACGKVNSEEALIIALPSAMYAGGKHCGRKVKITRKGGKGQTVTATVADECPTCTTSTSLDLSKGAFAKIATKEEGQVDIEWNFAN